MMRKLFLFAFLLFGFLAPGLVYAENVDLAGNWTIANNPPPTIALHYKKACGLQTPQYFDGQKTPVLPAMEMWVSQKDDGTIWGGANIDKYSYALSGKVTGNNVVFEITTGIGNNEWFFRREYSGSLEGDVVSGTLVAEEHYYSSEEGCSLIGDGQYTCSFTVVSAGPVDTKILSGPAGDINRKTVTFTYSGTSANGIAGYWLKIDDKKPEFTAQTSKTYSLDYGPHKFSVAAQDKTGDTDHTPPLRKFTIKEAVQPDPGEENGPSPADTKDPINMATGKMHMVVTDLSIPGKGMNFEFTRTYNSQLYLPDMPLPEPGWSKISTNAYGILGSGWTHNFNVFLLYNELDARVNIRDEYFKEFRFVFNADNSVYLPQRGDHSTLVKSGSGFTWTKKDGKQYFFDKAGKLTSIKDRWGNSIILEYNVNNQLTGITDTAGRKISIFYNSEGGIGQVTDPAGRKIYYDYDSRSHLVRVTDPAGNQTSYEYENWGNLTRKTDASGRSTYFTYNGMGYCTSSSYEDNLDRTELSYNFGQDSTTVTDSKGNVATYYHNDDLMITRAVDAQGGQTISTWDRDLNKISETDPLGRTTQMQYDAKGNLTRFIDPQGNATAFTYEPNFSLVTSITDAQSNVTTNAYDAKGNLTKTANALGGNTFYSYNITGQVTGTQNAMGKTTYFTYDAQGNLTQIKDALAGVTTKTYDSLGNLTSAKDPRGSTTSFLYDSLNRLIKTVFDDGSSISYAYDNVGNRISTTDQLGRTTYFTYNQVGKLISTTNALSYTTSYDYDSEENLICVTDPNNNKTTYEYDTLNRKTAEVDALGNRTQYQYDAAGNRTSLADAKGQITTYAYDSLNRLTKTTYSDASTVSYTYDTLGRRSSMTDSLGVTAYTYDKLGRLTKLDGPQAKDTITYAYDAVGNRLSLTDPDAKVTKYTCDALNRIATIADSQNKVASYAYDAAGNLTGLIYPNATKAVYTYDKLNRLVQLANLKTSVTPNVKLSEYSYTYDVSGRRTRVALLDGSSTFYVYDDVGQLIQESNNSVTKPYTYNYAYDPAGNRIQKTTNNGDYNYIYNSLNQLIREDDRIAVAKQITVTGTVSDPNGIKVLTVNSTTAAITGNTFSASINLTLGLNTITVSATDNAGNTIAKTVKITYKPPATTTSINYTYDANGNLIKKEEPDKTTNLAYDSENRLVTFNSPVANETYTYDGEGKRVSARVGSVTTNYLYDGLDVILERNGSDATINSYIRNPGAAGGIGGIISSTAASQKNYYHYDGIGTVTGLTISTGISIQNYSYDAFGNILAQSGAAANHNNFLTKQTDATGLIYYGARYYDPRAGRFITKDLLGFIDGPNQYIYCLNNPVNAIDNWGFDTYIIHYQLIDPQHKPTREAISHSYAAITENGRVIETISYGNKGIGQWFHNDTQDMKIAQEAINVRIGAELRGVQQFNNFDNYFRAEFNKIKNQNDTYFLGINDCKGKIGELLRNTEKAINSERTKRK